MITPTNTQIIDLALYLKKEKILVIADSHIGYEEYLNKEGILVPRFQFKEIIKRLEKILKNIKINKKDKLNKIIINGDIKHEFGTISEQEWRHTLRLLDFLKKYCNEIILIKGNHDTILGPIAEKRDVSVVDYLILSCPPESCCESTHGGPLKKYKKLKKINDKILIIHGDKINKKISDIIKDSKIKTIIIGHEHPAVGVREDNRVELFKCFLIGKYKRKNLIVQPSFNLVYEGADITKEKLLSPFLHQRLVNFKCIVVADKVYDFGKLGNLYK